MPGANPFVLFDAWFAAARRTEKSDATAMALATTDPAGHPAVRMVLLKGVDARGFVFYTHLGSPKSEHLRARPHAALCFHWPALQRQVRIEGAVQPVHDSEANAYFATRPRLSQLGAWASQQSQPMAHRFDLQRAVAAAGIRFALGAVPRPPHWSGWRVVPERFEFWRERPFRHHDRELFVRNADSWERRWLFP